MATLFTEAENPHWKRTFFPIWGGQAASLLGSQVVQFALIWYLTTQTESATVLATASIFEFLPGVFLSPFIGALVDRWNRRRIMIVADTVVALATLLLVGLFWMGVVETWHVYAIIFVRAVGGRFHAPAMGASTSLMVPKEHLTRIQGLNQTLQGGLNLIAAPLGALLMEVLPIEGVVAVDVITASIAVLPLLFIDIPQPEPSPDQLSGKFSLWQDTLAGFRYIFGWPGLFIIILTATLLNFFIAPTFSLLPLLVKSHFQGGALELSYLESIFGVGTIMGGILLGVWGGFRRKIVNIGLSISGLGLTSLIIGILPDNGYWLAFGAMWLGGLMLPIANGTLGAIFQSAVEPAMQGRVFSAIGSAANAMTPIGYALAGPLSDRFGIQIWFVVTGVVILLTAIAQLTIPALANIDQQAEERKMEVETAAAGQ
jgi:DHA3 family macrolide efflux protein-like MFS transporter